MLTVYTTVAAVATRLNVILLHVMRQKQVQTAAAHFINTIYDNRMPYIYVRQLQ